MLSDLSPLDLENLEHLIDSYKESTSKYALVSYKNLLTEICSNFSFKAPEVLYRGMIFEDKEKRDQFLEKYSYEDTYPIICSRNLEIAIDFATTRSLYHPNKGPYGIVLIFHSLEDHQVLIDLTVPELRAMCRLGLQTEEEVILKPGKYSVKIYQTFE